MKSDPRKSKITDEHRAEAAALKAIWEAKKPMGQAEFGKRHGLGTQPMVSQYLNGKSPLNLHAAQAFARELKCGIEAFSPRLAEEARQVSLALPNDWPFPHLSRERFDSLDDYQKGEIQGKVREMVEKFEQEKRFAAQPQASKRTGTE